MPAPILLVTSLSSAEEAAWRDALSLAMPSETIALPAEVSTLDAVEIAIVANPPPGRLNGLPGLRWIHSLWAGVDRLLGDATLPNVPLIRLVDPTLARAMAEAVTTAVMFLHRDLHRYARQQRDHQWRQLPVAFAAERKVCVLGLGEMGRASAAMLAMLGFQLRGWSRSGGDIPNMRVFAGPTGLAEAVADADILVNLLPLTPDTQGVLNNALFDRLAEGAAVINCGRGGHLVEADLLDALSRGRICHAVLDVFGQEPLPADHPLWDHPNVTILPHVAAPTNMRTASSVVAEAVATYRRTGIAPKGLDRKRGY